MKSINTFWPDFVEGAKWLFMLPEKYEIFTADKVDEIKVIGTVHIGRYHLIHTTTENPGVVPWFYVGILVKEEGRRWWHNVITKDGITYYHIENPRYSAEVELDRNTGTYVKHDFPDFMLPMAQAAIKSFVGELV